MLEIVDWNNKTVKEFHIQPSSIWNDLEMVDGKIIIAKWNHHNLKNPDFLSNAYDFLAFSWLSFYFPYDSAYSFSFYFSLVIKSKTAPSVMLSTFHMLFKFVSYLSSIVLSRLSTLRTFSSMDSNLNSTRHEMLF